MASSVLIVDDSALTRQIVKRVISISEVPVTECLEAENGLEAIALLGRKPIDLLITDINMPKMNGEELVQWIGRDPALHSLAVLVLSTDSSSPCIERLNRSGIRSFLSKPFTPETLRDVLERIFVAKQLEQSFAGQLPVAIETALDAMFFTPVVEPPTTVCEIPAECVHAVVDFQAEVAGSLCLFVEKATSREIAANVLGIEATSITDIQAADTVCELTNVVCGSLMSQICGDNDFRLHPPRLRSDEPEASHVVLITCESGRIFASFSLSV